MRLSDLRLIVCPYCGGRLSLNKSIVQQRHRVLYGVIQCKCDRYPVIDAIVILKKPVNRLVLEMVRNGRFVQARNSLIHIHAGYNQLLRLIVPDAFGDRLYRAAFRRSLIKDIGYKKVLLPFSLFPGSRKWADYLINLPDHPESKVVDILVSRAPEARIIIDIGCGVTPYATRAKLKAVSTLIGVDANFVLLYLSSLFFPNPNQTLLCTDLSHGFPVRPGVADLCVSLNCFTYLYHQKNTLLAMLRAAGKGGVVFIGDLPVSVPPEWSYWYTRPPEFYTKLTRNKNMVIDYDVLLQKIAAGKDIAFRDIPFTKTEKGRYGILFEPSSR